MTEQRRETSRILVVEDEPAINEMCRIILEEDGFEVDVALNGRDAQKLIERDDDYDLCLVDVRTPEMNGTELFWWLQEKHHQLADSVVFTTGDTMGGDINSFLEHSGRPFLPKPFTPGELRAVVRETLGK